MKLVQFTPGIRRTGNQIRLTESGQLTFPTSTLIPWKRGSDVKSPLNKVALFYDVEQETIDNELIVYLQRGNSGYTTTDKRSYFTINSQAFLKTTFPKYKAGELLSKIIDIEGEKYLAVTIPIKEDTK